MLHCFSKYLFSSNPKTAININYRTTTIKNNYIYKNTIITMYSLFFRKAFFRSLITYINILYVNVDTPVISNYFYFSKYIVSDNNNIHPGFLFKKYHIK
jgi:hypothetical protein